MPLNLLGADVVHMVDGRIFYSHDNWETGYLVPANSVKPRELTGTKLDFARYLAVSQSSWAGNAS